MADKSMEIGLGKSFLFGFIAGFFGTLVFHQLMVALLWGVGLAPFHPFSMALTRPFGVPAVISLSFWGGLWGLPEIEDGGDVARWCESSLGATITDRHEWQVLRHSFTHFRLDIRPMHIVIDSAATVVRDDDTLWHHPAQSLPVGVASPVGALLAKLRENCGERR